jgi:hypothetical protein
MKKLVFVFVLAGVLAGGAFAQVTVSRGLAFSSVDKIKISWWNDIDIDANVEVDVNQSVDYRLPISILLSLGVEAGVDGAIGEVVGLNIMAIPLLARAAYHFNFMPKLDLYVVGKIGLIEIREGDVRDYFENMGLIYNGLGVWFGFDAGAAYYFTEKRGVFAELGFDQYAWPFTHILTIGISDKI